MTSNLSQFLHEQAKKNQDGKAQAKEWRIAVEKLFNEIKQWLKESDPDGVIDIEETDEYVNEPGLGRYRVPRLNLVVLGKWVGIIPIARRTVGTAKSTQSAAPERALGRVDITDELRRYVLYRIQKGDKEEWIIDGLDHGFEEKTWPGQVQYRPRTETKPLDRQTFEKALMSYLQ